MNITPIAFIENDFTDKFGVPRQSGMTELISYVRVCPKFSCMDAFRGLDGFDYIWLIWGFDKANESGKLTVRPPRLGGNTRMGVFATRSPFRPNSLGLSSVKLLNIGADERGVTLTVSGADLMNGTPIYDIKPYLPFTDSHEDCRGGFADDNKEYSLAVVIPDELKDRLSAEKIKGLTTVLSFDPRPSYQEDGRIYGFYFSDKEVKFYVKNNTLFVIDIK